MTNYLTTANPFSLASPPASFLAQLHAYDSALVIFPSEKEPLYRIGRRGRNGHGLLSALSNNPDTAIYMRHRLWPWKSILPTSLGMQWARVLAELPNYDTQRFADPGQRLDDIEAAAEAALNRSIADEADQRAKASWHLKQMILGERVGAGSRPEGTGYTALPTKSPGRRRRAYRPLGAGEGAMFVGRGR